jgi:xylulose-5-phosphate/fructose-6-phosphate phosphoketolase
MTPVTTDQKRKPREDAAAAGPLAKEELRKLDAYWRASNYLSVGQIYLLDNPS